LSASTLAILVKYQEQAQMRFQCKQISNKIWRRNLNTLITGPAIYDSQHFAGVSLHPETQSQIACG